MLNIIKINNVKDYIISKKFYIIIILIFTFACVFYSKFNYKYYTKTIAKVVSVKNDEQLNGKLIKVKQTIKANIINGNYKGKEIIIKNSTLNSQSYDIKYKKNDQIFVSINVDNTNNITSAHITGFKRDNYLIYIFCIFLIVLLLIGGFEGVRALISMGINIVIFIALVKLYIGGSNLYVVSIIASFIFIILTLILVSGFNKKTLSAIISTLASTGITILITFIVIFITNANGIHYEEMEFVTSSLEEVFYVGLFIGVLGAIMDIAITISSSLKEICDNTPDIEKIALIKSGKEIGKDIMGTMTNTIAFAYFAGSMPSVLLWLKNGITLSYIVKIGINLEIIRALIGSIGIVLSIPISIAISILILKKNCKTEV